MFSSPLNLRGAEQFKNLGASLNLIFYKPPPPPPPFPILKWECFIRASLENLPLPKKLDLSVSMGAFKNLL